MAQDAAQLAGHTDNGIIAFEGLPNTRDLGGMPAQDGRRIRSHRLLRSGLLARATDTDLVRLRDEYDLRLDIDLRTNEECSERPDPTDAFSSLRFVHLPVFEEPAAGVSRSQTDMDRVRGQMMRGEVGPAQLMITLYPHMLLDDCGIAAYTTFFREILASTEGAVLWHCTAGKDRCGMASVFIECALGVPWEVIEADYMATNRFYDVAVEDGIPADPFEGVDRRYLAAAVDAVDREFGGMLAYIERALGVDADARAELRARYLEE
ncbi:tyrosine-protein phosphatase [Collinsella tanakaei]|uniref:tyrosine-protein phosphatase n=1 Tax=Collinsella tanakaei TaxID=626935 RepID=UPI0025A3DA34|nr:tyrosine-protein phosphatase [Collinsella tanakaei]MDM8302856.1 tyrosine-protein phosphatase [Collinsella tanakaei]